MYENYESTTIYHLEMLTLRQLIRDKYDGLTTHFPTNPFDIHDLYSEL